MVTSIVLLSMIVPSRHTGIGAWVNSKMCISILYNISLIVMQGYFTKKKKNEPRPSEHPPVVVGGGNKHRIHGKLGIQLSF